MPHFVDTNIVVYAYSESANTPRAREVLGGATISVQVLNEFSNVAIRKLRRDEEDLDRHIASITGQVLQVLNIDMATHDLARIITFKYKLNFYDAALLASAVLADCDTFYSEDMHDGLVIEGTLTIRNPFT